MKLVIEIDDKTYRTIKDGLFLIKGGRGSGRTMEYNALMAIYEGKPLEQEPKTGQWIGIDEEPHEDYECNKCGYVVSTYTVNIEPHTEYKFCHNCGVKMIEL